MVAGGECGTRLTVPSLLHSLRRLDEVEPCMSGVVTGGGGGVELCGIGRLALLRLVGLEWDD